MGVGIFIPASLPPPFVPIDVITCPQTSHLCNYMSPGLSVESLMGISIPLWEAIGMHK